jgi:nicotinamidase-related amidase
MMTDVCVASTTRAAMDYGFENISLYRCCYNKNKQRKRVLPAEQVTDSYLSGLNALGGLC